MYIPFWSLQLWLKNPPNIKSPNLIYHHFSRCNKNEGIQLFFVVWVRDVLGLWNIHLISEGLDDVWGEFAIQQSTTQQYESAEVPLRCDLFGGNGASYSIMNHIEHKHEYLSTSLDLLCSWVCHLNSDECPSDHFWISPIPHISCLLPPIIGVEKGSLIPFGNGLSSGASCWFWGGCVSTYPPTGWQHSSLGHHTHPSLPRWQTGSPKDLAISIVWWPVRAWLHRQVGYNCSISVSIMLYGLHPQIFLTYD